MLRDTEAQSRVCGEVVALHTSLYWEGRLRKKFDAERIILVDRGSSVGIMALFHLQQVFRRKGYDVVNLRFRSGSFS